MEIYQYKHTLTHTERFLFFNETICFDWKSFLFAPKPYKPYVLFGSVFLSHPKHINHMFCLEEVSFMLINHVLIGIYRTSL